MSNDGETSAFVFVNFAIGKEEKTLNEIRGYDGVRKVYTSWGPYSAILEVDLNHNRDVVHQMINTEGVYGVTLARIRSSFQQ